MECWGASCEEIYSRRGLSGSEQEGIEHGPSLPAVEKLMPSWPPASRSSHACQTPDLAVWPLTSSPLTEVVQVTTWHEVLGHDFANVEFRHEPTDLDRFGQARSGELRGDLLR